MRFYQIDYGIDMVSYYADLKVTKAQTRSMLPAQRQEVRVRLLEISTDKASMVQLLNRTGKVASYCVKQWRVTARHRYIETPADED